MFIESRNKASDIVLHYSEQLPESVKEDFLGDMKYELHFPGA